MRSPSWRNRSELTELSSVVLRKFGLDFYLGLTFPYHRNCKKKTGMPTVLLPPRQRGNQLFRLVEILGFLGVRSKTRNPASSPSSKSRSVLFSTAVQHRPFSDANDWLLNSFITWRTYRTNQETSIKSNVGQR